jgi:hypothetical protein
VRHLQPALLHQPRDTAQQGDPEQDQDHTRDNNQRLPECDQVRTEQTGAGSESDEGSAESGHE